MSGSSLRSRRISAGEAISRRLLRRPASLLLADSSQWYYEKNGHPIRENMYRIMCENVFVISKIRGYDKIKDPQTRKETAVMNTTKYIGVDVHSSTCSFCVTDSQGVQIDTQTIPTNGRLLIDYLKSLGNNLAITFEECDLSGWLFEILRHHVSSIVVCNPAANAEYKRAKTDKLDARRLADLLRGGYLHPVFHDASDREKFRVLVSAYEDTVQEIVRHRNRVRAIKRRGRLSTHKQFLNHIEFIGERLTAQLKVLLKNKNEYQAQLNAGIRRFKETKYLESIPGIGPIQTARVIAQVVDPHRFTTKYKFFAYCGLVRHPRISNNRRYGTVRIFGNRMLKCVFKMAAHSALRGDNALHTYYESLRSKGVGDADAANAVARKIATLTLTLWKNKQYFNEKKFVERLPGKE